MELHPGPLGHAGDLVGELRVGCLAEVAVGNFGRLREDDLLHFDVLLGNAGDGALFEGALVEVATVVLAHFLELILNDFEPLALLGGGQLHDIHACCQALQESAAGLVPLVHLVAVVQRLNAPQQVVQGRHQGLPDG